MCVRIVMTTKQKQKKHIIKITIAKTTVMIMAILLDLPTDFSLVPTKASSRGGVHFKDKDIFLLIPQSPSHHPSSTLPQPSPHHRHAPRHAHRTRLWTQKATDAREPSHLRASHGVKYPGVEVDEQHPVEAGSALRHQLQQKGVADQPRDVAAAREGAACGGGGLL